MMRPLPYLLLLLLPTLLRAETPLEPTEVTCDLIEAVSNETEMTTVLTGNVVVTGTNLRISCDRMEIVSLRSDKPDELLPQKNRFRSLVATGKVRMVQGEREANCGKAVVLPGDDKIILTENPSVTDTKYKVTYYGESLSLLRGERRVRGEKVRFVAPPIKDLGFDKEQKLSPPAP